MDLSVSHKIVYPQQQVIVSLKIIRNGLQLVNESITPFEIDDAQIELSKLGPEFHKNVDYLYLRGQIFLINKLYYMALDALHIATEFGEKDKIYNLIAKIYDLLGNTISILNGHRSDVISVIWSTNVDEILSSSDDGTVRRWNIRTNHFT